MSELIDRYAVMGNPIAHSKSPFIHAQFAKQTHQHLTYEALLVPVDDFPRAVTNFAAQGGKGLNITLPFKPQAAALVQECTARAQLAGAVNTIVFKTPTYWLGDNTDGIGLIRDMKNHQWALHKKRILLLGAGGAARGVIRPLLDEQPQQLVIANRTVSKAQELVTLFQADTDVTAKSFSELANQQFDIVINATAASLQNDLPPLPAGILAADACCYDMVYGKDTPFLQWARQQDCQQVLNGIGMLVEQAAESFYLWRGVKPQTAPVIRELLGEFG